MAENIKKEPLKYRNPLKYHRIKYYSLKVGKWASMIAPLVAVFGAKFNEYIEVYEGETYKLTIGCIVAIVVAVIACYKEIKKTEGETSPITTAIGWGVAFMLSYLFHEVITDLTLVLGCEFAGQCVGAGLDVASKNDADYIKAYKEETVKEEAKIQVQSDIKRRNGTRS